MAGSFPLKPRPPGARKRRETLFKREDHSPLVKHGFVRASDGTELFYSVEGTGKSLVFCYGLVCSSLHWTYQIDHFSQNYQVIWMDYRGHQNSATPKDLSTITVEMMAEDLAVVLSHLKVREAVLLGHSMGVNVVLEFYKKYPKQVAGLVLANGTAKRPLETIFSMNAFESIFKLIKRVHQKSPRLVSWMLRAQKASPVAKWIVGLSGFNPHLTPWADVESYVREVAEMDPAILVQLIENYKNYDSISWLNSVKAPTLIIAGECDKVIPVAQQELIHQFIEGSEFEVIENGSHCPQMDLPELVDLRIEKFLATLNYAPVSNPSKEIANRSTVRQGSVDRTKRV